MLDDHIKEKHADDIEVLLTEGVNDASEEIDHEEREGEVNGVIEERECPTPIPDNVVICAECNIGFSTSEDVTHHIQINHQEERQDQSERIQRIETELKLEKGQHQDHLDMLDAALRESSSYDSLSALPSVGVSWLTVFKVSIFGKVMIDMCQI